MESLPVRAAFRVVTPQIAVGLGANGLPNQQVATVADDIEVNVIVVGPPLKALVVATCDLLYVSQLLRDAVLQILEEDVHPDQLFFAASHTHRAPMVDPTKPGLGTASIPALQEIARQISDAIRSAMAQEPTLCRVEIANGQHSAGINRRRKRLASVSRAGLHWGPTLMAPSPSGPVDAAVRRLRFVDAATDTVVAEMWSTALHPTGYPRRDVISADFPGYVRQAIRAANGGSTPVAFLQGFSGDIRPATSATPWGLRRLLRGPGFAGFTKDQYQAWVEALASDVLGVEWRLLEGSGVQSIRQPIPSGALVRGGQPPSEGALHGLRIGSLAIVGVPSEVVVEYSSSLTPVAPLEHVWGVGCIDHVWGYAPTARMLGEGGYEVDGFCEAFGVEGVNPHVEEELRGRIESMVRALAES